MDDRPPEESAHFKLSHLYLKQIVKENHAHTIKQLKFNDLHPNLLASVGGTQASIYDNENAGNNFDVMMNFVNMDTPALLRVISQCESAIRKRPVMTAVAPHPSSSNAGHIEGGSVSTFSSDSMAFESQPMTINEESRMQINAMRFVIEEGGFDEDIHVGAKDMGLVHPKPSIPNAPNVIEVDKPENGFISEDSILQPSSSSAADIMPNRRLMQGIGRDIELFDRSDRKLNACAWVSFPPRVFLTHAQVSKLSERIGASNMSSKYNGACDVDTTHVDRKDAWLAVGGSDGLVQLLSIAYCKSVYILPGHCEPVIALASGRSGTCLASLSNNFIIIWNLPLIARHHYNSLHCGGPGLEHLVEYPSEWQHAKAQLPHPINLLPTEHTRWILQVIPTPNQFCTMLEFTQFGLVAGTSDGNLYLWSFISNSFTKALSQPHMNHAMDTDEPLMQPTFQRGFLSEEDYTTRNHPPKRNGSDMPPNEMVWKSLPQAVVDASYYSILDWPAHGEQVYALANVKKSPRISSHALAVRTSSGRLVIFSPAHHLGNHLASHEQPHFTGPNTLPVNVFWDLQIPSSPNSASTTSSNSKYSDDLHDLRQKRSSKSQSLAISACSNFALVGNLNGDAYIFCLSSGSVLTKLEHKRSKSNVSACVIAHHANNVTFSSEAMLWRWDFISPSFLQKERAEQARAEAEGVDILQPEPEDDAPDDLI